MEKKIKNIIIVLFGLLLISLSMLIFGLVYQGHLPKLVEEINNASIGAILTAIITVFLLSQQTSSEEIRERNSAVFNRKLDLYNSFNSLLEEILKDNKIDFIEQKKILFNLANMQMLTSTDGIKKIYYHFYHIYAFLIFSKNTESYIFLEKISSRVFSIISVLKEELYKPIDKDLSSYNKLRLSSFEPSLLDKDHINYEIISKSSINKSEKLKSQKEQIAYLEKDEIFQEQIILFNKFYHYLVKLQKNCSMRYEIYNNSIILLSTSSDTNEHIKFAEFHKLNKWFVTITLFGHYYFDEKDTPSETIVMSSVDRQISRYSLIISDESDFEEYHELVIDSYMNINGAYNFNRLASCLNSSFLFKDYSVIDDISRNLLIYILDQIDTLIMLFFAPIGFKEWLYKGMSKRATELYNSDLENLFSTGYIDWCELKIADYDYNKAEELFNKYLIELHEKHNLYFIVE